MSFEAQNWASKVTVGDPAAKSVLMCLANMADQDGKCWPGYGYITKTTEYSRRTVIDKIALLVEKGLIKKITRNENDGQTSNIYEMKIGSAGAAPPSATAALGVVQELHPPSAGAAPYTSVKHQLNKTSLAKNANGKSKPKYQNLTWNPDDLYSIATENGIDISGMDTRSAREKIKRSLQG